MYEGSFCIWLKQNCLKTGYWCIHRGVLHVDIAMRIEEDRDEEKKIEYITE